LFSDKNSTRLWQNSDKGLCHNVAIAQTGKDWSNYDCKTRFYTPKTITTRPSYTMIDSYQKRRTLIKLSYLAHWQSKPANNCLTS